MIDTPTYSPLISGFIEGLKPEPRLSVTEWAESRRVLDSKASAEPGPYRIARTPYLKEISDNLSVRSPVQNIIVMKGVQLGFTEVGFNWMGYVVDVTPCSMMYLMPTIDTMERNVKARVDPMIEICESLREKIGRKRSRDGGNTLHQKDYPGGVLYLSGANSAASLASIPVKYIIFDEIDRYPGDVDGEGDPISLAEKRQSTYGSTKKKYKISTPTIKGLSKIESAFEHTDQRYFFVPCPHCNQKQTLEFAQLRWDKGIYNVNEVYYECRFDDCKKKIYERHKTYMLDRGEWLTTKPENISRETIGYHINSLYSPDGWMSWSEICQMWDEAQGDNTRLKTIINTIFAQTYEEESEAPEWQRLFETAQALGFEPNKPVSSIAFITAGVDVQADRLEIDIVGWSQGRISQQIDYRVLDGDVDKDDVWQKLADILDERFEREDKAMLSIRYMAIDTGYKPGRVDDFAKKYGTQRIVPIKGQESVQMPYSAPRVTRKTKAGKNIGKLKVWHVGVSYLKSQLYGWLRQKIDPETGVVPNGYCHFTKRDAQYFRGITAEAYTPTKNKKNMVVYQWVKKYERNEPLDTRIYAMAAAYMLGFDRWNDARWTREINSAWVESKTPKKVTEEKQEKTTKPARRRREGGSFWDR